MLTRRTSRPSGIVTRESQGMLSPFQRAARGCCAGTMATGVRGRRRVQDGLQRLAQRGLPARELGAGTVRERPARGDEAQQPPRHGRLVLVVAAHGGHARESAAARPVAPERTWRGEGDVVVGRHVLRHEHQRWRDLRERGARVGHRGDDPDIRGDTGLHEPRQRPGVDGVGFERQDARGRHHRGWCGASWLPAAPAPQARQSARFLARRPRDSAARQTKDRLV